METTILNPKTVTAGRYYTYYATAATTPVHTLKINYLLSGRVSPRVYFKEPLEININNEDGYYIVSDAIFLVYGEGKTIQTAMDDYVSSLVEFYEIVKDESLNNKFEAGQLKLLDLYIDVK